MREILIAILTVFLINNFCLSQFYRSEDKLKFGVKSSIDFSFRFLKNTNSESYKTDDWMDTRNQAEIPLLTYSFGAIVEYQLMKNLSINVGAKYSEKGLSSRRLAVSNEYAPGTDEEYTFYSQRFKLIQAPISFIYYYLNKPRLSAYVNIGGSYDFMLSGTWDSRYKLADSEDEVKIHDTWDRKEMRDDNFNIDNLSAFISTGIDFRIGEHSTFRLAPFFSQTLLSLQQIDLKEYHYNYGLGFGYLYSL